MKPIKDVFLRPNNLLALEFREGWIFTRVVDFYQFQYRPFSGIGTISSDSYTNESRLNHTSGNTNYDVLYIERYEIPKVMHVGIGIFPEFIKMYVKYPEGTEAMYKPPTLPSPDIPNGSSYGMVTGKESPYDEPTDATELFIPPQTHVGFQFYNPDEDTVEPILNIIGRVYKLEVFRPYAPEKREYYHDIIRKMAKRIIPCAFGICGNPENPLQFDPRFESAWKVKPISLDEAQTLP